LNGLEAENKSATPYSSKRRLVETQKSWIQFTHSPLSFLPSTLLGLNESQWRIDKTISSRLRLVTIDLKKPKTRKKPVSRSGKTLKTKATVLGLALLLPASLLALTYSSQSSAQAVWPITSLQSPPPDGASQLTFLDQQVFAFNVPHEWVPYDTNHHYWNEYSFGSTVPSNAIMALCVLKLAGVGSPYGGSDSARSCPNVTAPTAPPRNSWHFSPEAIASPNTNSKNSSEG